jgi:hypothetical protein
MTPTMPTHGRSDTVVSTWRYDLTREHFLSRSWQKQGEEISVGGGTTNPTTSTSAGHSVDFRAVSRMLR